MLWLSALFTLGLSGGVAAAGPLQQSGIGLNRVETSARHQTDSSVDCADASQTLDVDVVRGASTQRDGIGEACPAG